MLLGYFPFVVLFFNQISPSVTSSSFLQDQNLFNTLSKLVLELPNDECKRQFLSLLSPSMENQEWLMKMVDASAKPQAGILAGNVMHIGNYDECLGINFNQIRGKYCTVLFGPHPEYGRNLSSVLTEFLGTITKIDDDKVIVTDARYSYGFCVPNACTTKHLQTLVNLLEDDLEFPFHFTFMEEYCDGGDARPFTTSAIVGIIIFSSFGILLVVSTIYDIFYCQDRKNPNLLLAFSVLSNGKRILNTSSPEGNLGCLNGLRVISMAWIVLCHSAQHAVFLPHTNSGELITFWKNSTATALVAAGHMAVDTFFAVSGLLVVYLNMKSQDKGVKFSLPTFYLHRIIRLTPSLIMVMVFTVTLMNYIGRGPFWPIVNEMLYKPCESNWWSTLIYLQNYINPNNQCVGHAWYLAVDTQMYFLSPLIFFPLIKWPKHTISAIIVFVILNCSYVFEVTWKKHIGTTFFDQDQTQYNYLYSPTHVRGTVYLIGMLCGYFVYKTRTTTPLKLSKEKVVCLWIFSLSVMLAVVLGHSAMFKYEYNVLGASFFNSLIRVGWGIATCIIILLCVNDYGGPINTFLSWPVFTVLIRLNYNIYLLHLALMMVTVCQERSSTYFSALGMFHYFWGDYVFAVGASVLWTLAFESPVLTIEKIIFGGNKRSSKRAENIPDLKKEKTDKDSVAVSIYENRMNPSAPGKTD